MQSNLNDAAGLEKEADVMGSLSSSLRMANLRDGQATVGGRGAAEPFQSHTQQALMEAPLAHVQRHAPPNAPSAVGATAFATGNNIAFGSQPNLHTAAHEAAHVVQQRAGVQL